MAAKTSASRFGIVQFPDFIPIPPEVERAIDRPIESVSDVPSDVMLQSECLATGVGAHRDGRLRVMATAENPVHG